MDPIAAFRGKWTKLGNYSMCTVFYEGHAYPSTEHAYQAAKLLHEPIAAAQVRHASTPGASKKIANSFKHLWRTDWHTYKVEVMRAVLREKFSQEPERSILLSTGDAELIEGNWWHDNFWGDCRCGKPDHPECVAPGKNMLGVQLMELRRNIRDEERAQSASGSTPDS